MLRADLVLEAGNLSITPEILAMARESVVYTQWAQSVDGTFDDIERVTVTAVDFRSKPSAANVMFVRLAVNLKGAPTIDYVVELRGGTVVMLVVLNCDGIDYTVLVQQPRLPTGRRFFREIPAGMLDGGALKSKAMEEIREELGLAFTEDELIGMNAFLPGDPDGLPGVYFSPGILDEWAQFYCARRVVDAEMLDALEGRATGNAEEGETIKLTIVPLRDLPYHVRDMKSFVALFLYENYVQPTLEG